MILTGFVSKHEYRGSEVGRRNDKRTSQVTKEKNLSCTMIEERLTDSPVSKELKGGEKKDTERL